MPKVGQSQIVASQVLESFRRFDTNRNGYLERSEVVGIFQAIDLPISEEHLDRMLEFADKDGNQVVDYTEFLQWVFTDDQEQAPIRIATGLSRVYSDTIAASCPKRLILVRHGESEGNVDHRIYETHSDGLLHLTERGWQQARSAGRELRQLVGDEPLDFLVSPYVRTRETFNALVEPWGGADNVTWREDPRLREQDFGNFQDFDVVAKAKAERQRFGAFFYRMPNGESPSDVFDRLSSFFETMYRSWDTTPPEVMNDLNYVIVCHGITIAAFLMRLFKYSVDDFHRFQNFTNAEFCVMERQPNGKYTQETLYCVKQRQEGDVWKGVRGPRSIQKDAGRFDRAIRVRPESEAAEDLTRTVSSDDTYEVMTFQPGRAFGFRCCETNRVEMIIVDSQADDLGVMPGWFLVEVDRVPTPEGGAKQAMLNARRANKAFDVKFRRPARLK